MLAYTSWLKVSMPRRMPQILNAIILALPGSSGEFIFTSSAIMGDISIIGYHLTITTYNAHPYPCTGISHIHSCCSSQSLPCLRIPCTWNKHFLIGLKCVKIMQLTLDHFWAPSLPSSSSVFYVVGQDDCTHSRLLEEKLAWWNVSTHCPVCHMDHVYSLRSPENSIFNSSQKTFQYWSFFTLFATFTYPFPVSLLILKYPPRADLFSIGTIFSKQIFFTHFKIGGNFAINL